MVENAVAESLLFKAITKPFSQSFMKIRKKISQQWGKDYRNDVNDVPIELSLGESRVGFPGQVAFVQRCNA